MDEIKIEIEDKEFTDLLTGILERTTHKKDLMLRLAETMKDAVENQFATEGYGRWPKLSVTTMIERSKKGTWPGKMLQDSMQLIDSIQSNATDDDAEVFTNKVYAARHQKGFDGTIKAHSRKTKNGLVPVSPYHTKTEARPFMELEEFDKKKLIDETADYVLPQ